MSCYVDPLFHLPSRQPQAFRVGEKHGHQWCHLWADTLEELHAMAAKVGMRREWFQNKERLPHYDLVPPRRAAAIKAGAFEVTVTAWRQSPILICPDCKAHVRECGTKLLLPPFRDCGSCFVGSPEDEWRRA